MQHDVQDAHDARRRALSGAAPRWHPILAAIEVEPGHGQMVAQYGEVYGDTRLIRRGQELGYRGDDQDGVQDGVLAAPTSRLRQPRPPVTSNGSPNTAPNCAQSTGWVFRRPWSVRGPPIPHLTDRAPPLGAVSGAGELRERVSQDEVMQRVRDV